MVYAVTTTPPTRGDARIEMSDPGSAGRRRAGAVRARPVSTGVTVVLGVLVVLVITALTIPPSQARRAPAAAGPVRDGPVGVVHVRGILDRLLPAPTGLKITRDVD